MSLLLICFSVCFCSLKCFLLWHYIMGAHLQSTSESNLPGLRLGRRQEDPAGGEKHTRTVWINVKVTLRWNALFYKLTLFANSLEKASTYPWPRNPRKAHWASPASHSLSDRASAFSFHIFSFQSCLVSLGMKSSKKTHWCSSFAHLTRQPVCSRDSLSEEINTVDLDSGITCSNLCFFYLFNHMYS